MIGWFIFCVVSKILIGIALFVAIKVYIKKNAILFLGYQTREIITHLTDDFIRQVQEILNKEEK